MDINKTQDPNKILDERNFTHGEFSQVGAVAQTLKRVLRETPNWKALPPAQQEALEMDAAKTARILCGNHNEPDHWNDKAGYALLGARACADPTPKFNIPNPPDGRQGRLGAAENKPAAVPFTLPIKKEEPPKSA